MNTFKSKTSNLVNHSIMKQTLNSLEMHIQDFITISYLIFWKVSKVKTRKNFRLYKFLCLNNLSKSRIRMQYKKGIFHFRFYFTYLESIHYNLVLKIRQHIGGQFLHQTNLRKSASHTQQGSLRTLHKSLVVCDPLRGFSQICRMQNLTTNMWSYFSNKVIMNGL